MTKITVYDTDDTRIAELADELQCSDARIIEALLNMLDVEAASERRACAEMLEEYM